MTGGRGYISPYIGRETYFLKGKNTSRVDNSVRCLLSGTPPSNTWLFCTCRTCGAARERQRSLTASPTSTVPFARQSSWLLDNVTRRGMQSYPRGICMTTFFDVLVLRVRHARRLWGKAALALCTALEPKGRAYLEPQPPLPAGRNMIRPPQAHQEPNLSPPQLHL